MVLGVVSPDSGRRHLQKRIGAGATDNIFGFGKERSTDYDQKKPEIGTLRLSLRHSPL